MIEVWTKGGERKIGEAIRAHTLYKLLKTQVLENLEIRCENVIISLEDAYRQLFTPEVIIVSLQQRYQNSIASFEIVALHLGVPIPFVIICINDGTHCSYNAMDDLI